jgi:hypothetical protein
MRQCQCSSRNATLGRRRMPVERNLFLTQTSFTPGQTLILRSAPCFAWRASRRMAAWPMVRDGAEEAPPHHEVPLWLRHESRFVQAGRPKVGAKLAMTRRGRVAIARDLRADLSGDIMMWRCAVRRLLRPSQSKSGQKCTSTACRRRVALRQQFLERLMTCPFRHCAFAS